MYAVSATAGILRSTVSALTYESGAYRLLPACQYRLPVHLAATVAVPLRLTYRSNSCHFRPYCPSVDQQLACVFLIITTSTRKPSSDGRLLVNTSFWRRLNCSGAAWRATATRRFTKNVAPVNSCFARGRFHPCSSTKCARSPPQTESTVRSRA